MIFSLRGSKLMSALGFSINQAWLYSVFRGEIETKTTFSTFVTVFCFLIWSAMISMYGWRELLIHLYMMQDRIEPKMSESVPTKSMIHNFWKAWFSISIVPMDSSKSQCLWVTVKARTKNSINDYLVLEKAVAKIIRTMYSLKILFLLKLLFYLY